jgi:hypothetical protein
MTDFLIQFAWMCLAGCIPVLFFSIDNLTGEKRKWRAFKRFMYSKRGVIGIALAIYAIVSVFTTVYGYDVVSSLALLTPIPAATSFGVGVGVSIGAMLKDGE